MNCCSSGIQSLWHHRRINPEISVNACQKFLFDLKSSLGVPFVSLRIIASDLFGAVVFGEGRSSTLFEISVGSDLDRLSALEFKNNKSYSRIRSWWRRHRWPGVLTRFPMLSIPNS